jgi:hypothetical protein
VEQQTLSHFSPTPSDSSFLRGVDVLPGVSEERRESARYIHSSKERDNVVTVSTPYRHLILSI